MPSDLTMDAPAPGGAPGDTAEMTGPRQGERDRSAPSRRALRALRQGTTSNPRPSDDAFLAASRAFGASSPVGTVAGAAEGEAPPIGIDGRGRAAAHSSRPGTRRRHPARGIVTAGVMGVAGLFAVSTTLPSTAIAALRGSPALTATSIVVAEEEAAAAVEEEIQAFVAPSDLQSESIESRSDEYSSASVADLAAEQGIAYSSALYTNDPDAAIQWPFVVGVAMSSGYGMRNGRMHQGIDLVPGDGAPIQSIADGTVRIATESGGGYGVTAYVDHVIDGQVITSHYSHMQYGSLRVQAGDTVKVGDIIGLVGNTGRSYGAHLHFELIVNGATIDPLPWMQQNAGRESY